MMSTNNILSPASGKPIVVPSQDMVLGIYYLTYEADGVAGEGSIYANFDEVQMALDGKFLDMHAKIKCRMEYVDDNGELKYGLVETTAGRIIVSQILPKHKNVPFSLVNRLIRKKKSVKLLISFTVTAARKKLSCLLTRLWLWASPMLVRLVSPLVKTT